MVEGDVLADVEQAVPVTACRTVQLLHPQAATDGVVDRTEGLPPFDVGGHAHAVVVVVGVAVGLRAQHVARVAVRIVLGGEAQARGAAGQALRGAAIGIDEEDLAAVAAAVHGFATEIFRFGAARTLIADLCQVRWKPVATTLHAVPVGGHRGLEPVAAVEGRTQVTKGVLAQRTRAGTVVLVQIRNAGEGADQVVAIRIGGKALR